MVLVALKCSYCGSENVRKNGHSNGKQRYTCNNADCLHKTFYDEYTYNGRKPNVKQDIIKWSINGAGIRAISRELGVSTDTVISELKKREFNRVCKCGILCCT